MLVGHLFFAVLDLDLLNVVDQKDFPLNLLIACLLNVIVVEVNTQ